MREKLSVCVVTKNEAHNIEKCLQSVNFADEIIVVDSESTDETVTLAQKFTSLITTTPFAGCGQQKRTAVAKASHPWVLILDADERVSSSLSLEIQQILENPKYSGYIIPFQSHYCGHAIKFGDWWGEKHLRLFRKDKAEVKPRLVHFNIQLNGKIGKLKHKIYHYSFPNLDQVLEKINRYSSQGALVKHENNNKASIITALSHGIFTFFRGYILKLGFIDGSYGLMLAISNAEGAYYKYLKLRQLTIETKDSCASK